MTVVTRTKQKPNAGMFGPGNKAAVGSKGASRPTPLTQALLSQLNEVDRKTSKLKLHMLAERLIALALGGEFVVEVIEPEFTGDNEPPQCGVPRDQIEVQLYEKKKGAPLRVGDPVFVKRTSKDIRYVTRYQPPDLAAIREVFDRVQGKSVQAVGFDAGTGKVTITFDKEDEDA